MVKYSWNRGPGTYLIFDNSWPSSPRAIVHDMDFAQLIVDCLNEEDSTTTEQLKEEIRILKSDLTNTQDENEELNGAVQIPDMH